VPEGVWIDLLFYACLFGYFFENVFYHVQIYVVLVKRNVLERLLIKHVVIMIQIVV